MYYFLKFWLRFAATEHERKIEQFTRSCQNGRVGKSRQPTRGAAGRYSGTLPGTPERQRALEGAAQLALAPVSQPCRQSSGSNTFDFLFNTIPTLHTRRDDAGER